MEPFAFQGGMIFWTIATFACLFLLLARFVFKPLRKILEERECAIRRSLDEAETARRQAGETLARNQAQLEQARDETRKIISEGHRIVTDMKHEAQQGAKVEAQALVEQAHVDIDREIKRSLAELKGTVVNLSVRIARQVVREDIDEQRHEELAETLIEKLRKTHVDGKG